MADLSELANRQRATHLEIAPLTAQEIRQMLTQQLQGRVPAAFLDRLAEASGGNPLYLKFAIQQIQAGALRTDAPLFDPEAPEDR